MDPVTARCSACGATFDLSGKPPGTEYRCPKCKQGSIRAPEPEIETLDAGREVAPAIGSADELTEEILEAPARPAPVGSADELTEEVVAAPPAGRMPRAPSSARRGRGGAASGGTGGGGTGGGGTGGAAPASRRRGAGAAASGGATKDRRPLLLGAAVVVIAAVVFALTRGGGDGGGEDRGSVGGRGETSATSGAPRSPAEEFAARLGSLADDDAEGRRALAAYCAEHGLAAERGRVLRELLLLVPDDAEARTALGFERYDGPHPRYRGRWLSADDLRLAKAEEP